MMDTRRLHAQIAANRIVNFRRRWANKSDTAIKAVLNYFWRRQAEISAAASKDEDSRRQQ